MTAVSTPSPRMRRRLLTVHRWLGLTIGAVIAAFALAGSVLVWADELEAAFAAHPSIADTQASPVTGAPQWQKILDQARTAAPWAKAWVINPSRKPGEPAEVVAEPADGERAARLLSIRETDGQLLDESGMTDTVVGTIFHFHTRLLSDQWGHVLVLGLALVLLVFVGTGIYLWWPRRWGQSMSVRLGRGRTMALWDLHRVTGAAAALLLLVSIATGIVLLFPGEAARAVDAAAGAPALRLKAVTPGADAETRSLDELVARADAALPGGIVTRIIVPAAPAPWTVRKRLAGEAHPNGLSFVRLDPITGEILQATTAQAATPGVAMFAWVYPLHIGLMGGTVHKIVLTALGLAPTVLCVTGVWLWWRKRPRQAGAARSMTPAGPQP